MNNIFNYIICAVIIGIPGGIDQQKLAESIAGKAAKSEITTDSNGNVTGLFFSNHKMWEKENPGPGGITDEEMKLIINFKNLRSFKIERQQVTTSGCESLKDCPEIRELKFHYMANKFATSDREDLIDPDFMLVANHFKDQLEVLEIKHNFKLNGTVINQLLPMPKLKKLVLDNESAHSLAVPYILSCPNVEDLRLHRTLIKAGEMKKILRELRNLKVLWIRPSGDYPDKIDYKIMKDIGQLKDLEQLMLKLDFGTIPFEDGFEHLVHLKKLKRLQISEDVDPNSKAVTLFLEKRPDVDLIIGYNKITQ